MNGCTSKYWMQLYQLLLLAFASIKQSKASAFILKLSCLACLFQRFSKGTLDCTQSLKLQGCQSVWLGYVNQCEFISSTLVHSGKHQKRELFCGWWQQTIAPPVVSPDYFWFSLVPLSLLIAWPAALSGCTGSAAPPGWHIRTCCCKNVCGVSRVWTKYQEMCSCTIHPVSPHIKQQMLVVQLGWSSSVQLSLNSPHFLISDSKSL